MIPRLAPRAPVQPATEMAGAEFFTTAVHYRSLAGRILAAFAGGGQFILVTGSTSPDAFLLSSALSEAAGPIHSVIGVPCRGGLDRAEWLYIGATSRFRGDSPGSSVSVDAVVGGAAVPIYVLEGADRLTDEQLRDFAETQFLAADAVGKAVLTVGPAFIARLERPGLRFLLEGLAARIVANHLGQDEIPAFIDSLVPAGWTSLPSGTISAIAAASWGDPALVRRLAQQALLATGNSRRRTDIARGAGGLVESLMRQGASQVDASAGAVARNNVPPGAPGIRRLPRSSRGVMAGMFVVAIAALSGAVLLPSNLLDNWLRITWPRTTESVPTVGTVSQRHVDPLNAMRQAAPATLARAKNEEVPPREATGSTEKPAAAAEPESPTQLPGTAPKPATDSVPPPVELSGPATPPRGAADLPEAMAALVARGDDFLATGDIVAARLFYERAAEAGDGRAALLLGETFDPAVLARAGRTGVRGDVAVARTWYRRARDLGQPEASRLLTNLEVK